MPRKNKIILRTGTGTPSAVDFAVGEPAFDSGSGTLYIKNAAGQMAQITGGGGGGGSGSVDVYAYATTANFPATGASAVIYIATDTSRIYQWVNTVYVELGPQTAGDLNSAASSAASSSSSVISSSSGAGGIISSSSSSSSSAAVAPSASSSSAAPAGDPYFNQVALLLHMDGTGSAFIDSSKYSHTVTASGDATQSTAQSKFGGKSAYFDGTGDYLSIPTGSHFNFGTGDFAIECWFYVNSIGNYQGIFGYQANQSGSDPIVRLAVTDTGVLDFTYRGGALTSAPALQSQSPISAGQWYYVAVSRSNNVMRLYLNGVRQAEHTPANPATLNAPFSPQVGAISFDGSASWLLAGYVDELRVTKGSDRGYTSATIPVPTAPFPEATPGTDPLFENVSLLLHGDGNLTDASIYGHAVTAVGNAAATGGAKYGSASIAFDGNQDWLSIPASTEFDFPGDFTIEFWVYFNGNAPPTLGSYGTAILARYDGYSAGANKGWQVRIDGETYTTVYVYTGATSLNMSGAAISQNVWHHVAVVRSGSTIKSYLDGVQYGDPVTNSEPFVPSTALPLYAGAIVTEPPEGYRLYLNGRLDDIRITKGVARYLSTFTPPTSAFADYAALVVPEAPTGLTATPNDQSVALSWSLPTANGSPAITDYVVQYSSDAGSNWTTVSDGTSTARSATVTGLTNGTEYLFRVAAVNSVGTSSYSSTVASTPAVASVLTITAQPQNTYSATNTDTATFSVTANITGGATITYQWQYYGWDSNYNAYGWNNISGQTSSTLSIAPNTYYSMGIIIDYGDSAMPFRCVVTGSNNAGTITSNAARWAQFSGIYWEINAYGYNGSYAGGSTTINGIYYNTMTLSAAEDLIVNYYDMGPPWDSSWYTGNAFTLKLQVSDDASTWTDLQTVNTQSTGWYDYFNVSALSGVTKYYRVSLDINWPFNVTNGATSARSAPATTYSSRYRVTWP